MNGCAAPGNPRLRASRPARRALRRVLIPPAFVETDVDKHLLDPEAITVESFDLGDSTSVYMDYGLNCTGCDSGCGIFPNP